MKTSLFNIILDDGGDIMLFNSMRGLNSLCKVSENCREKVLGVLNGTVEDKEIEDRVYRYCKYGRRKNMGFSSS